MHAYASATGNGNPAIQERSADVSERTRGRDGLLVAFYLTCGDRQSLLTGLPSPVSHLSGGPARMAPGRRIRFTLPFPILGGCEDEEGLRYRGARRRGRGDQHA